MLLSSPVSLFSVSLRNSLGSFNIKPDCSSFIVLLHCPVPSPSDRTGELNSHL